MILIIDQHAALVLGKCSKGSAVKSHEKTTQKSKMEEKKRKQTLLNCYRLNDRPC